MRHPEARTDGLVTEPVDDGLVIYDQQTGAAHALNAAVVRVFELCDGTADTAQIAAATGLAPALVEQAIAELGECGLLVDVPPAAERISRREVTRRLLGTGAVAMAMPLIYSVAVPAAAAALSTTYCSSNCSDYTPIAAADCPQSGPGGWTFASPGVCQSGICYQQPTGSTFHCAPVGCVNYGGLNCTTYTGLEATPCCSTPSACHYVAAEGTNGCYS